MTSCRPILLVDDDPMDVELILRAVGRSKLVNPIEVARDGEEALAWVPRWKAGAPWPVVILININLPKVSGLEVLRQLKSHVVYRTIPIIALTTSSSGQEMEAAYQHGANSCVVKPVDFDQFMDIAAQIEAYWAVLNQLPQ